MTYRTGNHWGVTIVREGTEPPAADGTHADDQLVAVVLHDDAALAERICALLNGYEQQVRMVEHGRQLLAGYDCPDHPGPLDDARDHVCRLRPVGERP